MPRTKRLIPYASLKAREIVFDCTEEKIRPKHSVIRTANSTPIHRCPRARSM
jgi:hypothetical protein